MSDKNNINKLEELFKNRLQNFSIDENDDWNIPGDDVFDNAQAIFNKKEKDDRFIPFFWYFIGLGILCLMIIAGFIITNSNIIQIQNEIEHINQQSILSPVSIDKFSDQPTKNIKSQNEREASEKPSNNNHSQNNDNTLNKPTKNKQTQNNKDQTNQLNKSNNKSILKDEIKGNYTQLNQLPQSVQTKTQINNNAKKDKEQKIIITSNTQTLKNPVSADNNVNPISKKPTQIDENKLALKQVSSANNTLDWNNENQKLDATNDLKIKPVLNNINLSQTIAIPIIQPILNETILNKSIKENKAITNKPSIKKKNIELALLYAPSLSAIKVKYELTNEINKGSFSFTNNFELRLKYNFSKQFYLRSGISFNKYRINSDYYIMSYYDNSNEQHVNGVYETNISMDIETPLVKAIGDVVILHESDTPIPEGDMITSEIELSHFFSAIEIPLNIGIQKNINEKFSVNLGTGISYNKSFNNEMSLNAIMMHDDHVMEQKNPSISYDAFKKSFFNYNVELGTAYKLTNSLGWYMGASYRHSISSVIQKENTRTNIQTINIKTGLTYRF